MGVVSGGLHILPFTQDVACAYDINQNVCRGQIAAWSRRELFGWATSGMNQERVTRAFVGSTLDIKGESVVGSGGEVVQRVAFTKRPHQVQTAEDQGCRDEHQHARRTLAQHLLDAFHRQNANAEHRSGREEAA